MLNRIVGVMLAFLFVLLMCFAPKQTKAADYQFTQTGMASWYGKAHHGKKMANGKPFNMYANLCAHRRIPLGTLIMVTNTVTGVSVQCSVQDRGPYHGNRVLDVSYGVAKKLGMVKSGTAKVKIETMNIHQDKVKEYIDDTDAIEKLIASL